MVAKPHPLLCSDHSRFALVATPNETPLLFDVIQIWKVCRPEKSVKQVRLLRIHCDMRPDIVLLEYRVECILQQEQNNRLHSLCDEAVHCQTTTNMHQRRPIIKYYATPNHDARRRTGLVLSEMGWFVTFSGCLPHPSTTVIPPQTEKRFTHEHYPMSFDGPGMMTIRSRSGIYTCVSLCCWCPYTLLYAMQFVTYGLGGHRSICSWR
ncbi:hypothetical protein TNCV_4625671 [Trichonephila clavipes]|nr:hypothetical protein TNCV_4625671 [Trichonephila clavipes]